MLIYNTLSNRVIKLADEYCKKLDIANAGIKRIILHLFGGEPLLFLDDILPFIAGLKNIGVTVSGSATTNGYLLNEKNFKEMLDYGITSFQITIDGDPQSHNETRKLLDGSETYSTIFQNLKNISKSKDNFSVVVRCNMNKTTKMDQFLQDFKSAFRADERFSLLLFPIARWNKNFTCSNLMSKGELFKKYTHKLKNERIKDAYLDIFINNAFCCDFSFPLSLALMPNGKANFCTIYFEKSKEVNIEDYFANLKRNIEVKTSAECERNGCALYPKCFGFRCQKSGGSDYCDNNLNDIKTFLLEYFS